MARRVRSGRFAVIALCVSTAVAPRALEQVMDAPAEDIIRLWPGVAPETPADWTEPEFRGRESFSNVTVPTLSIFRPEPGTANGTAIVVAPGGAFTGLAWNLEGYEVARWFAERGVTAFVLKYRVRRGPQPATPPQARPVQPTPAAAPNATRPVERPMGVGERLARMDGLQAVKLLRQEAAKHGIRPDRIGFIGFSAGAMTAMNVTLAGDPASRPDFAVSVYGGMRGTEVRADAPPIFIAVAQDDRGFAMRSVDTYRNWTAAGRPAELHIYEKGGHGFGMRKKGLPVDAWPQALEAWMKNQGLLADSAPVGGTGPGTR